MPVPLMAKISPAMAVLRSAAMAAMRVVESCILSFGVGLCWFFGCLNVWE